MLLTFHLLILLYSVRSEQAFSVAGDIVAKKRNRLQSNTVRLVMLTKSWLGLVEYEMEEFAEELLDEEGAYEADGESGGESDEQEASIVIN